MAVAVAVRFILLSLFFDQFSRTIPQSSVLLPALRLYYKLHAHAFMVFTADHRAQNFVLSRLGRSGQGELLLTRFQFKVPAGDFGMVFLPQQREAVHCSVTVPGLAFARI